MDKKKGLSPLDFFCIGFGAVIGVGWAVSINGWFPTAGGPVPTMIGYLCVLLLLVPVGLTYSEMVPMMPVAGGGMAFAYKAFGEKTSFIAGWAIFGGFVAVLPWESIQVTDVLNYLIPGITDSEPLYYVAGTPIYLVTIIIGVVCSILLFLVNARGAKSAATLQKCLCVLLLCTAVIGCIACLIAGKPSNLEPLYDTSNPQIFGDPAEGLKSVPHHSFLMGVLFFLPTAIYFQAGFETIPQGVESAGGDIKKVGRVVLVSILSANLFMLVVCYCFGSAIPWQEFSLPVASGGQMVNPAPATMLAILYPGITGKLLYWMLVIGAMCGLFTTWNGFFMASSNLLVGMARGRLVPVSLSKVNKSGAPMNGLILCLVLSLIGPFVGIGVIGSVTTFSTAGYVVSWLVASLSFVRLRTKHPEMHRPYKAPLGKTLGIWGAALAGILLASMMIPGTPAYIGNLAVTMTLAWAAVGVVLFLLSGVERRGLTKEELEHYIFWKEGDE